MGTVVVVRSVEESGLLATRDLFEDVEQACSRFRPDSELRKVNRCRQERVVLSPVMLEAMNKSTMARALTDGLVNVGVGGAIIDWGYDRDFRLVADAVEAPAVTPDWKWGLEGGELVRPPGLRIDLGGVAKGWACDLAVEAGHAAVVSAGGDIRSSDERTTVEVIDPWNESVGIVPLGVGALATSSVTRRRWRVGSTEAHHLIDPRTGQPSRSPILSASAIAATAVEAEAAAKAILQLGVGGLTWADRQSWIDGAIVVWHDAGVYSTPGLELAA